MFTVNEFGYKIYVCSSCYRVYKTNNIPPWSRSDGNPYPPQVSNDFLNCWLHVHSLHTKLKAENFIKSFFTIQESESLVGVCSSDYSDKSEWPSVRKVQDSYLRYLFITYLQLHAELVSACGEYFNWLASLVCWCGMYRQQFAIGSSIAMRIPRDVLRIGYDSYTDKLALQIIIHSR